MLEDYMNQQPIVTKLLINSFNNNKIVQAYLFVSNDKSFLLEYAKSFAKKLITDNYDEKICNMIDENIYPELKIINPINNIIKKEQVLELRKSFLLKPKLGNKMVYIINEADKLYVSSANTILKFLEEPSDDIVAILLTDNLSKVLPTIKSRCQNIILKNKKESKRIEKIYNEYVAKNNIDITSDIIFKDIIDLIKNIEKKGINEFIHFKDDLVEKYKTKDDLIFLFDFMLYFYYDILNKKILNEVVYMNDYLDEINEISNNNDLEKIQKKIQVIEEIKIKAESNMNTKLLLDGFIIRFSEV